jgi:NAD(P) transhydrogenase subunit alpha
MENQIIVDGAAAIANDALLLAQKAAALANQASLMTAGSGGEGAFSFVSLFTIFILACFVGYYVVWRVTPALHSPLMAVTNAISSVIVVGAILAAGPNELSISAILGFVAVILASVNIFGGFIVTERMLSMFKKKQK